MGKRDIRKNILVLAATVMLLTAILVACTAEDPQSPGAPPSVGAPEEIQRVTLEESKAALDNNAAVFLDVRSADTYATSHIPGALSIPLDELEARMNELDPDQWIITYCT